MADFPPLNDRDGLPEALRVLLSDYPREAWEADPGFAGLVQFWLERHGMFRKLNALLSDDAAAAMDGRMGTEDYRGRLSHFGGMLLGQLHDHHHIEDAHYFPQLTRLDARLEQGFALLDSDHHALDGLMRDFADAANAVLAPGQPDAALMARIARFRETGLRFARLVERHLDDEEDLIVPLLLKHGAPGL